MYQGLKYYVQVYQEYLIRYKIEDQILNNSNQLLNKLFQQLKLFQIGLCGLFHNDLKPENILVCLTYEYVKVLVDKGQINYRQQFICVGKDCKNFLDIKEFQEIQL
ncbi:unnamed protein product [Paramecium sonneborni]|uniref:Protein kinase domain-containing protein n=1 Tax=Paramecium sonneborni TaxID=65129 RepID=A0A8S1RVM2_9CILI|nr:unnamed protein product [Paramecium sonneborni]